MSTLFEQRIVEKAKGLERRICIPEAQFDGRVLEAAAKVHKEGWLIPVLVGDMEKTQDLSRESGIDIGGIEIIDPLTFPELDAFSSEYARLRAKENIAPDAARDCMVQPLYFGAMLVRYALVDGLCAGAYFATRDVLRPGLRVIGRKKGTTTVCSMCPLVIRESVMGNDLVYFLADCGVVPQPDAEQLTEITVAAADMAASLIGTPPKTAMISFSTFGSASHPEVEKVAAALEKVRALRPDLEIDGEMQLDTAIVPKVAARKAPDSAVAGKADLLILPNLDAANATIKAMQCFSGGKAISTMILGLNGRVNDHTRGASAEEIALNMALTAVRTP